MSPDVILIDFYGTICSGDRRAVEETCRGVVDQLNLSVSPENLARRWGERFFSTIENSNGASFKTLRQCETQSLRATLAMLDCSSVSDDEVDKLVAPLEAYWRDPPIHEDAVDFLKHVRRPVCCVSNADHEPLSSAIEKHSLRFEAVITSEMTQSYKPHGHIFESALQIMGVAADRAIHIGDSLHSDVAGANAAGIGSVWICREDRIHDIGESEPNFTASTLSAINTLLT